MITVIGSINLDLIAKVERLPGPGETVSGTGFATAPGGKGANQALAAARAGGRVRMVGSTGRDAFAHQALRLLEGSGVDLEGVKDCESPTGTALILVDQDGENMITVVAGANATVDRTRVEKLRFTAGECVLLQHEIPLEAVSAALERARAADAVSILNIAPFQQSAGDLVASADFVIANETEFDQCAQALGLQGADRNDCMQAFVRQTGRTIVLTRGGGGARVVGPALQLDVAALSIEPVDTVGAGDTFCGYFAAGLASGLTLEDTLLRAAAAGSLACLSPGAQPSIPMAQDVERALSRVSA